MCIPLRVQCAFIGRTENGEDTHDVSDEGAPTHERQQAGVAGPRHGKPSAQDEAQVFVETNTWIVATEEKERSKKELERTRKELQTVKAELKAREDSEGLEEVCSVLKQKVADMQEEKTAMRGRVAELEAHVRRLTGILAKWARFSRGQSESGSEPKAATAHPGEKKADSE